MTAGQPYSIESGRPGLAPGPPATRSFQVSPRQSYQKRCKPCCPLSKHRSKLCVSRRWARSITSALSIFDHTGGADAGTWRRCNASGLTGWWRRGLKVPWPCSNAIGRGERGLGRHRWAASGQCTASAGPRLAFDFRAVCPPWPLPVSTVNITTTTINLRRSLQLCIANLPRLPSGPAPSLQCNASRPASCLLPPSPPVPVDRHAQAQLAPSRGSQLIRPEIAAGRACIGFCARTCSQLCFCGPPFVELSRRPPFFIASRH